MTARSQEVRVVSDELPRTYLTLSTEAETLDQRAVTVDVDVCEVAQQAATLSDQEEQATTRVVVFGVGAQVIGQFVDMNITGSVITFAVSLRSGGATAIGCLPVAVTRQTPL